MKIAIRMDDITPHMDWSKFERFKELLDQYQIKPLIGVVPDNRDDNLEFEEENTGNFSEHGNFWQYVKQLQEEGWVIAMHGYQHVYTEKKGGLFPLNHFSEFAGISYEKQYQMLEKGKEILKTHGIQTDFFMAPAHSYDRNTLKALKMLGFTRMTDGFGKAPYEWQGITFYPISFRLSSSLKKREGFTTMVIHANTMTENDMERCRRILEEKDVVSYGEYLKEKIGKRGIFGRIKEYILANVKHMLVKFL